MKDVPLERYGILLDLVMSYGYIIYELNGKDECKRYMIRRA